MHIYLERHAYAPELNKAHIMRKGLPVAAIPAPGCTSIKAARAYCFPKAEPRRIVAAHYERAGEWSGLNRTLRAAFPLKPGVMLDIAKQARRLVDQGGTLIDGRILPPATLRLETRLGAVKGGAA